LCLSGQYEGRLKKSRQNFVEVRWRSLLRSASLGKRGPSYNAPPTSRKCAADCWSLRNFLPRSSFSWLEKTINRIGRDLDCMADVLMRFHQSASSMPNTEFSSDLAPCDFWAFPTMKRELRGKEFRSIQRSAARFRELGGAL
jgi:hypothetical protein